MFSGKRQVQDGAEGAPPMVGRHRRNNQRERVAINISETNASPARQVHTVADVTNWLATLGFDEYAKVFAENEIDGQVLKTLDSEELRDDLGVINLRHRRDLLDGIHKLVQEDSEMHKAPLPEHGRILSHLSNVRTYHSWLRVGVQMLAFAIVTLRLSPTFGETAVITTASFYFAAIGILALLYGIFRYRGVIESIEGSGPTVQAYQPDRIGVLSMLVLVLIASIFSLVIILLNATD